MSLRRLLETFNSGTSGLRIFNAIRNVWMIKIIKNENYDIANAMSSSRADPVLGHCPGWGYLNI